MRPHGTVRPHELDIFDVIHRYHRSKLLDTSKLIATFHTIPEHLAQDIAHLVLEEEQAQLFHRLRAVHPMEFLPKTRKARFLSHFGRKKRITWAHFAEHLDLNHTTFWIQYHNISHRVVEFLIHSEEYGHHIAIRQALLGTVL